MPIENREEDIEPLRLQKDWHSYLRTAVLRRPLLLVVN